MQTDGLRDRWNVAERDGPELRVIARDLGHELIRNDLSACRQFISWAGPSTSTSDTFVHGFRTALVELIGAYEQALEHHLDERRAEESVIHEGWWRILEQLAITPMGPSRLADQLESEKSSMSRTLERMREAGLVEVVRSSSGKERPHRLTMRGDSLLSQRPTVISFQEAVVVEREELTMLATRSVAGLVFQSPIAGLLYLASLHMVVDALREPANRQGLLAAKELRRLLTNLPQQNAELVTRLRQPAPDATVCSHVCYFIQYYLQNECALRRDVANEGLSQAAELANENVRGFGLVELGKRLSAGSGMALAWSIVAVKIAEDMQVGELRDEFLHVAEGLLRTSKLPLATYWRIVLAICRGDVAPDRSGHLWEKFCDAAVSEDWLRDVPEPLRPVLRNSIRILLTLQPHARKARAAIPPPPPTSLILGVPRNDSGSSFYDDSIEGPWTVQKFDLGAETQRQMREGQLDAGVMALALALEIESSDFIVCGSVKPLDVRAVVRDPSLRDARRLRLGYPRGTSIQQHCDEHYRRLIDWIALDFDEQTLRRSVVDLDGLVAWDPLLEQRLMALGLDYVDLQADLPPLPMALVVRWSVLEADSHMATALIEDRSRLPLGIDSEYPSIAA
jgi:DNA-binding MarR family transcriptional regulator